MANELRNSTKATKKDTQTFGEYGYVPDGEAVRDEYLVRITSIRNRASVVGLLQEPIQMRVESRWDAFIPTSVLAKGNMLLQLVSELSGTPGGPKSLITKASSRRLWMGSTPMVLSLKLKFESINDSFRDVVEPCRILQSLALPSDLGKDVTLDDLKEVYDKDGMGGVFGALPTLTPPGPSPFSWEGVLSSRKPVNETNITNIIEGSKGGDRIILQLGKFLKFDDVIVREVTTNYPIKMDMYGDPVSADVVIILETYEIPTVQSLKRAYEKSALFGGFNKRPMDQNGRRELHITSFE